MVRKAQHADASIDLRDITFHQPGVYSPGQDRYQPRSKPTAKYANAMHPVTGAQIQIKLLPSQEELAAYHLQELQRITGNTYTESGSLQYA